MRADQVYDESRTSPAVGVVFKPIQGLSLYANYIEGLGRGGIAPMTAANSGESLPPIVAKQFEVGVKRDFGSYALTLAAFQIKRPAQFLNTTTNVFGEFGEQRNRGLELSAFGTPLRGLKVLGGASFIDAKILEAADPAQNNQRAVGVPRFQANADVEVDVPALPGLSVFGRALYTASTRLDFVGVQSVPSWTRWDAGANYRFKAGGNQLTARLAVTNLFDRDYWIGGSDPHLILGEPRTVLLSLQADF